MSKPLHIIYIPGFGDNYDIGRRTFLKGWHFFGVTTEFVPMCWNNEESYEEKLARVNAAIDKATSRERVVLIGESAGGSVTLPIYAKRSADIYKAMTICGKNGNAASVSPILYKKHPAFREAMQATEQAVKQLDKNKRREFVSFYPFYDEVIPFKESVIPECQVIRLPSIGHFLTISLSLTIFSSYILQIAKR